MLTLKNITKTYKTEYFEQNALDNVSVSFESGVFTAILGESGSGKSTLLNIVSGLDIPTEGEICFDGIDASKFSKKEWAIYRNNYVGFIFQEYNLINHLKVVENVELPLLIQGVGAKEARAKALEKLEMLELTKHKDKLPTQLSGGQQQRVSIARALVTDPKIIMADEPTGALDEVMGKKVLKFIKNICKDKIVIMVTHEEEFANEFADRIIRLSDGKIIEDTKSVDVKFNGNKKLDKNKTKMPVKMEFKFGLNNITSRMIRTIFTSITVAIGLISIFVLVFLMTGINRTIDEVIHEILPENVYTIQKETNTVISKSELEQINNNEYIDEAIYDHAYGMSVSYYNYSYSSTMYNLPENKNNFVGKDSLKGSYPTSDNEIIISSAMLGAIRNETITNKNIDESFEIVKNTNLIYEFYDKENGKGITEYQFKIVGVVESYFPSMYLRNSNFISFYEEVGGNTNYGAVVNAYFNTTKEKDIEDTINKLKQEGFVVENIGKELEETANNYFSKIKLVLVFVASISLLVSGILVGLIVYMSVVERVREIGILTAIGASPKNIRKIFIFEAGILGAVSVVIAFIISIALSGLGNKMFGGMLTSAISLVGINVEVKIFRIDVLWTILIFLICILYTVLIGIIPASKAARMKAVNTLRKE